MKKKKTSRIKKNFWIKMMAETKIQYQGNFQESKIQKRKRK